MKNMLEGQQEWRKRLRKLQKTTHVGHVRRMKEEHVVRRMLDVDIPWKEEKGDQT